MAVHELTSLDQILATLATWGGDMPGHERADTRELDDQIAHVTQQIERLNQQLEGLRRMRAELEDASEHQAASVAEQGHDLVFDVLKRQAHAIAQRARQHLLEISERLASLEHALRSSEAAELVEEYEQFVTTIEPTLGHMPESYRSVMLSHHGVVLDKLREHIYRYLSSRTQAGEDPLAVDICFAHDAPEDDAGVFVVLLPLEGACYSDWQDREEGLQLALASRVVQALYEALARTGPAGAEVIAGSHADLLVLEVDVTGADPSLGEMFQQRASEILSMCRDLRGAGLATSVTQIPVDYVFPDDEAEEPSPLAATAGVARAG